MDSLILKKLLLSVITLTFVTHANANPNLAATCALTYWSASSAMAAIGNAEQQKNFSEAGFAIFVAGNSKWGKDTFAVYIESNKERVKNSNDNQLITNLQNCIKSNGIN